MELKQDLNALVDNLKSERDEILLKLHLASMEVKNEFESLEPKWDAVLRDCAELGDDAVEAKDEALTKAKRVGEEIKHAYQRIRAILTADDD
ncbi:MAG: hypothetical protein KGZ80_07060 [Methylomonas sp.]|nr:hypothetical protein [Methylomonas sp.]PPD21912.1 MAG: hypothetical protein CTY23_03575 [Methylomonas sp.]PPD25109.1 MAG: hypothetical protein CTY22_09660 [Methylomonas sp.]PPD34604.1 MAG: hypothetical protein CTY21_09690 [Methylomonas sp.]PPD40610.1 MAG: hypothetical protein CTY17_05820 [Methylomonas sp.]